MKNLISLTLTILVLAIGSPSLKAQVPVPSSCDTCTAPWVPSPPLTIMSQTISTKMPSCKYTFFYKYRTRICNGQMQVDIEELNVRLESGCLTFCCLNQPGDCYNSRRAAQRALANHLGPITLSRESACYSLFEVDPPQAYIDCALSQGESQDHWYAFMSCDTNACCKVILTPLGGGPVQSQEVMSVGCSGNVPPIPATVTWNCGGMDYVIPVMPGQTPTCEATCNGGMGVIHKLKPSGSLEEVALEERLSLYPNPSSEDLTIDYSTASKGALELKIYSIQGQLLKTVLLHQSTGQYHLNAGELPTGQYVCHIYADKTKVLSQSFTILD